MATKNSTVNVAVAKNADELFRSLIQTNVNDHIEQKGKLSYLSWSWAWQEFKLRAPDATYKVHMFEHTIGGNTVLRPYTHDNDLGYMVFTEVTALGQTHTMWLPVMDSANRALKSSPYPIKIANRDRSGVEDVKTITIPAATMTDINKTIMRCLVKNIAMFGLGLYIYAGEDLPTDLVEPASEEQVKRMIELGVTKEKVCAAYKVQELEQLTYMQAQHVIDSMESARSSGAPATSKGTSRKG